MWVNPPQGLQLGKGDVSLRANIYAEGIANGAGHFYATHANIDVGEQVPVRICHDVAARKQQGALGEVN